MESIDFKTARQIITSEYNEHWNPGVETRESPLFNWHDANHVGHLINGSISRASLFHLILNPTISKPHPNR